MGAPSLCGCSARLSPPWLPPPGEPSHVRSVSMKARAVTVALQSGELGQRSTWKLAQEGEALRAAAVSRIEAGENQLNMLNLRRNGEHGTAGELAGGGRAAAGDVSHCGDCSDGKNEKNVPIYRRAACRNLIALVVAFAAWNAVPETANGFSLFGEKAEKDPIEPFTVYGSVFKKYLIEDIVDGKIVGRRKGFTATACVNVLEESKETPQLQSVPTGMKVNLIGEPRCAKGEGASREESCDAPCDRACDAAVERHVAAVRGASGYSLDRSDRAKVQRLCAQRCKDECTKPGKSSSFVLPFRL